MVTGLPQISIPSQVCEECVVGKQHRSQFPQGKSRRAKNVLELVHSDICGPINQLLMGEKSEAFSAFKSFKARVEKETGRSIKILRTDRGGEYCSNELNIFVMIKAYEENSQLLIHRNRMKSYIFCSKHDTGGGLEWRKPAVDHFKIFVASPMHMSRREKEKLDDKEERQQLLQQQIPTVSIPESPPNDAPTAAETSSTAAESNVVAESRLRRVRKRPAWMQDFELNKDGGVDKYKARLVAKGYKQEFGVDYKEVFAPVAKLDTIRLVLSMAAQNSWSIHQLDVKSAFLHGELEEEVYIDQPPGYVKQGYENQVVQSSAGVFISQKKYALEILDKFMLKDCNSVITPSEVGLKLSKSGAGKRVDSTLYKQIVGSLMYLTSTRPDIMHAVNLISRYMENPTEVHLLAAKRIFRYLKDSDYAGDLDDRKSTSGAVFMLNSGAITWSSKKQQIVTLSTTEAEFVAAASSSCQAIWLRRLLEVLYNQQQGPTVIYCDNLSAIKLSKNLVLHGRSKHIDVRYHFLRDLCKDGVIDLVFCKSEDQIADILTKPLKPAVFMKLRSMLGVCSSKEVVAASGKALQIDS
ncbi:Retrovirus-related Pol polyprotein from transposon RE1 [Vitis vinifera]|uniref:Retrovirus-related Pol polyprotein from transposon RE1 n=1 Tax=Vitis vinifera TaxID=29760 RepID=A0A438DCP0_VITVI|nr:Retrovirus-related Pol polyprotein from transposon RE1 [Vitis vinifera]